MASAFRSLSLQGPAARLAGLASRGARSSVRARLVAMLVASAACLGLVALLGLMGLRSGEQATQRLARDGVGTVSRLGDPRAAFNGMARYEMDMLVNFESPPLTEAAKKAWWTSYEAATAQIRSLAAELPEAQAQRAIASISSGIARYRQGLEQLIPRLERGEVLSAGVGNQLMIEHRKSYASAEASVAALQEHVRQHVAADAQALAAQAQRLTTGLAVASAALLQQLSSSLQQADELTVSSARDAKAAAAVAEDVSQDTQRAQASKARASVSLHTRSGGWPNGPRRPPGTSTTCCWPPGRASRTAARPPPMPCTRSRRRPPSSPA